MFHGIEIEASIERDTLNAEIRPAWKNGPIRRVRLSPGVRLYKLTQDDAVDASGHVRVKSSGRITEWWFSYDSWRVADARDGKLAIRGIADVLENAQRTRADIGAYLRARGAVCWDWNRMTHVLVVELKRSAVGLVGTCSGQPFFANDALGKAKDASNVSFIGGEQQFFLGGLEPQDVAVVRYGAL